MGTEVLRPHDCLIKRLRSPHPPLHFPRRQIYHHTPKPTTTNRKQPPRRQQRSKSAPLISRNYHSTPSPEPSISSRNYRSALAPDDHKPTKNGLVMEKVTILRRGESLDSKNMKTQMRKTGYGSDPELDRAGSVEVGNVYAGSAFSVSPEPRDLPLPSFSKKNQISFDDFATRDLRRLLRLD